MNAFKNMIARDICNTFLDLDFFGEIHTIEGNKVVIVVDSDTLKERQGGQDLAVAESSLLVYVKSSKVEEKAPGELLNLDGREYIVDDWSEDMGLATIALSENIAV